MASTSALLAGLSGLTVNARRIEVIGNNIANVNVTAFKSSRLNLSNTFSRNFSLGSVPSANSGGTNPGQIGLGANVTVTQRNMNNAPVVPTGVPTDIGIEGAGFFIVSGSGDTTYTRAGNFQLNANNELVTTTGQRVQGYGVDENFNIVTGRLTNVEVPLGTKTIAEATKNVNLAGNLKADGVVATTGTVITFSTLQTGGAAATGATLLTALDPAASFAVNDTVTLTGATRGGKTAPDATFTVTATSTVDDYMNFLMGALGVVTDGGYDSATDPAAEPGGYAISGTGVVTLTGNFGTANDIAIKDSNMVLKDATGATKTNPFIVAGSTAANGESVRTGFVVYDSLGSALNVDLTMVLARTDSTGTYWRAFMHSADDTDSALHLEAGDRSAPGFTTAVSLMKFDNFGKLVSSPKVTVELDRLNTGAADPLKFDVSFDSGADRVTAFANTGGTSQIAAKFQDGSPIGTLTTFSVGDDGTLTGGFSNGLVRTIGQLALANFNNPEGLVDVGNNQFRAGPNSGNPVVTTATQFGTGRTIGGALEQSNVDLSQQFIEMIQSSTGYSAASRVISTSDQLLQQLLAVVR
ncbi:MAG: flagellar hook-basal body complex protein [Planctomycetes bacterium]|nr:flagellar hook-basal body complex protein [Planctomycetota bacterium]